MTKHTVATPIITGTLNLFAESQVVASHEALTLRDLTLLLQCPSNLPLRLDLEEWHFPLLFPAFVSQVASVTLARVVLVFLTRRIARQIKITLH